MCSSDLPYKIPLGQPFEYILGLESVGQANAMLLHSQEDETLTQVIPTRAHAPPTCTAQVHTLQDRVAFEHVGPIISGSAAALSRWVQSFYGQVTGANVLPYKKVDQKIRPVPTTMPAHAHVHRSFPVDPLASLIPLSPTPLCIGEYGVHLMKERWEELRVKMDKSLWEEEVKLVFDLLKRKERALAWCEAEKGRFQEEYFPPVVMPTIKHVPWA